MLIAAVFVLAAAIVLTSVLIVRSNKKKRAAVIGETQTEAAVTDAELEVFGEDESVSSEEETTSAIMFEIDEKMKNVQIATGDSKKMRTLKSTVITVPIRRALRRQNLRG